MIVNLYDYRWFAFDYGCKKIVLVWDQDPNNYKLFPGLKLLDLIKSLPDNCVLIGEVSAGNFDILDYNNALDEAQRKNIDLRAVSTRPINSYRREHGRKKEKNSGIAEDVFDAQVLLKLYGPGAKKTKSFMRFKYREDKGLPENFQKRINAIARQNRRTGWVKEKEWLKAHRKSHKFIDKCCMYTALVVGFAVLEKTNGKGGWDLYKKHVRVSENGRGFPQHRSNSTHHFLKHKKYKDPIERELALKWLNNVEFPRLWKVLKFEYNNKPNNLEKHF